MGYCFPSGLYRYAPWVFWPCALAVSVVTNQKPLPRSAWTRVVSLGPGPGWYLDLAMLAFQVPVYDLSIVDDCPTSVTVMTTAMLRMANENRVELRILPPCKATVFR